MKSMLTKIIRDLYTRQSTRQALRKVSVSALIFLFLLSYSPLPVLAQQSTPSSESPSSGQETSPAPDTGVGIAPGGGGESAQSSSGGVVFREFQHAVESRLRVSAGDASGSFSHSYPLPVPSGRNKITTPSLSLNYNSLNTDLQNLFGLGWSVSVPSIERLNKTGIENLYIDDYFTSSFDGELATTTTANVYTAKNESGSFLKYEYLTNHWKVTDKQGNVYTFGQSASTRQDDPSDSTRIYKWMLEKLEDSNGNYISYTYFKDNGQIYPDTISYTNHPSSSAGDVYDVVFLRETRSDNQPFNYPGFSTQTKYRINSIEARLNGAWIKKFDLGYTTGENGVESLLNSITEQSKSDLGAIISQNTSLTYQLSATDGWTEDTGYTIPEYIIDGESSLDFGVRLADVNGDALPDIIRSYDCNPGVCGSSAVKKVYTNDGNGTGWTEDTNYTIPEYFIDGANSNRDEGTRLADVNGDGLVDILRAVDLSPNPNINNVHINKGDGTGWTLDTNYSVPEYFVNDSGVDRAVRLADVNGDGLVDVLRGYSQGGENINKVFINDGDGTGWTEDTNYTLPEYFNTGADTGTRLADVNGDGLEDVIRSYDCNITQCGTGPIQKVYINDGDGTGWTEDTNYTIPEYFINGVSGDDYGVRLVDVNGDNLVDFTRGADGSPATNKVYINQGNGTGWALDSNYSLPEYFVNDSGSDQAVRFIDIDGNGQADVLRSYDCTVQFCGVGPTQKVYINQGDNAVNLLISIDTKEHATIDVSYKPSTHFKDGGGNLLNPDLPFVIQAVETVTTNDGLGNLSTTSYEYSGGDYFYQSPRDRQFAGFELIKETDDLGNVTKTYHHQGNSANSSYGETEDHEAFIARPYKVEQYDNVSNLFKTTYNDWDYSDLGSDAFFAKLNSTAEADFDGDASHKDRATEYTYDSVGNVLTQTDLGEVIISNTSTGAYSDTGGNSDKTISTFTYATDNGTGHTTSLVSTQLVQDGSSNKLGEAINYYDNLALGQMTEGNLTKDDIWVKDARYNTTNRSYNNFGQVLTETDDNNHQTSFAYDSFSLFPASVTNALTQTTSFTYDYNTSQAKTETDPNGSLTETKYDGLGRVVEVKKPDPTSPTSQVVFTALSYDDTSNPRSSTQTDYLTATLQQVTYTYIDGLDRAIQTRSSSETANTYSVADTVYDSLGRVEKQSLPYFSTGSVRTAATTNNNLYTTYIYDALDRVKTETNAVGSTSYSYDDWKTVVTDPLTNQKDLINDARGNLVQVTEYNNNGVNLYHTYYEYDLLNNLTKITDAEGNIRSFTYDALGNRLSAEDLHAPADITFGTYTYTYDDIGNLLTQVNPEGDTVTFNYDDINRVLTENSNATTVVDKSYTYDTCSNGIGRLCSVTTSNPGSGGPANLLHNGDAELNEPLDQGYQNQWNGNLLSGSNYVENSDVSPVEGSRSFRFVKNSGTEVILRQEVYLPASTSYDVEFDLEASSGISGSFYLNVFRMPGWHFIATPIWIGNLTPGSHHKSGSFTTTQEGWYRIRVVAPASGGEIRADNIHLYEQGAGGGGSTPVNVISSYSYNLLGNTINETKTIDSSAYTTSYEYDRAANVTLLTNPNSYQTRNTYNAANLLEKVETKESGGSFTNFINNFDYNPLGQVTYQDNANGTDTTNTYDENELYRLKNKLTMAASSGGPTSPTADFSGSPTSGDAPLTVQFTDTSTPGSNPITSWQWDIDNNGTVDYTTQNPSHQYSNSGTYTVKLTVSDGTLKDSETKVNYITVNQASGNCGVNNLLFNCDFESAEPFNQGDHDRWGAQPLSGSNRVEYDTHPSNSTQSAKITTDSGGYGNPLVRLLQSVNVEAGKTYVFEADIYNASGILGKPYIDNYETGGCWCNQGLWWSETLTPGLTQVYKTFTPSVTNRVSFQFRWDNAEGETWIDNVKVYEQGGQAAAPSAPDFRLAVTQPAVRAAINVFYSYDKSGHLKEVKETGLSGQVKYYYTYEDLVRLMDLKTKPAKLQGRSAYLNSPEEAVFHIASHIPGQTHIQDIDYVYDLVGNITQITDNSETNAGKTATYGYDDLYRLTSATITNAANGQNYTRSYTYSPIGNILTKVVDGNTSTYSYNGNQGSSYANPHAVTSIDSDTYTYDKNGNLLSDGTWTHTWSYDNRLVKSDNGTTSVSYAYDESGQRALLDNGSATHYPNSFYNKDTSTSGKETIHIFANGNSGTVEMSGGNTDVYTNHTDHLTGSNVITDSSENISQLLDYFPFGDIRLNEQSGALNEQRKFTGHELDEDTNLLYMGARYYPTGSARLTSADPIALHLPEAFLVDPQQFNTYSYARNNPLRIVDPTGLYNVETGEIEEGDTQDIITDSINEAFGINTNWDTIADVSFYSDRFGDKTLGQLVGQSLRIGTNITTDISEKLGSLNKQRANTAALFGPIVLLKFNTGASWDIKNSGDNILGLGEDGVRDYWSYTYNGELIRYDAPGNINYGYVASASGLRDWQISSVAAAEQIASDRSGSFADNAGDRNYIQQGINSYRSNRPWWHRFIRR